MAEEVIIDRGTGTEGTPPEFVVPEEYRDKTYMKDIDSQEKLYKAFDGLQVKLGERPAGIPGENATDDERNAFNKAFGVPESFDKYTRASLPEGTERNTELDNKLMDVLHKAGVSDAQFKIMEPLFNEVVTSSTQKTAEAQAAQDAEFDKVAGEVFGDKRDTVMAASKALLDAHVPEKFKSELATLDNKSLLIMAGVLDGVRQKYISEDTPPDKTGAAVPVTQTEISAKARELMATAEYKDAFHPGHNDMVQRVNDLYAGLRKK